MVTMSAGKGQSRYDIHIGKNISKSILNKHLGNKNKVLIISDNGVPKKHIKELKVILNRIDATAKQSKEQKEKAMKQLADIMDMKGRKIKPGAKIMGGEEVVETEAEILERLKRGNKETVERIREKKLTESFDPDMDDAIDNVSPGFSGDMKVDAELVAEELAGKAGKVYDDLDIRERMTFYDKAYKGLSEKSL